MSRSADPSQSSSSKPQRLEDSLQELLALGVLLGILGRELQQPPGGELGFLPALQALVQTRDVVERGERVGVILAQDLGPLRQTFEEQRLRLPVAALTPE